MMSGVQVWMHLPAGWATRQVTSLTRKSQGMEADLEFAVEDMAETCLFRMANSLISEISF